jgi:hypothetical protein
MRGACTRPERSTGDVRGGSSYRAREQRAVILHEFNGHACRYRHRHGRGEGEGGVLFYMPFRDAIATCAPPPSPLVGREARAAEIDKRAAKESRLKGEAISIPRESRPKRNIRWNLIHFPPPLLCAPVPSAPTPPAPRSPPPGQPASVRPRARRLAPRFSNRSPRRFHRGIDFLLI